MENTIDNGNRRHNIRTAAKYIDRSENATRKLIHRGYINASKARDGSLSILQSELDAFMNGTMSDAPFQPQN